MVESEHTLCERSNGGITVQLRWLPKMRILGIIVFNDNTNESLWATIPEDKGMDAFNHPFCYLPAQACERVLTAA